MGLIGVTNRRAMADALIGHKSGNEIRENARKISPIFGENMFVRNWADYADKTNPKTKSGRRLPYYEQPEDGSQYEP